MVKHTTVPFNINMSVHMGNLGHKKGLHSRAKDALSAMRAQHKLDYSCERDTATITMRCKKDKLQRSFRAITDVTLNTLSVCFNVSLRPGYSYSIMVIPEDKFVYVRELQPSADADPYARLARSMHLLRELRQSSKLSLNSHSKVSLDAVTPPTTHLANLAHAITVKAQANVSDGALPSTHACISALLDARWIREEDEITANLLRHGLLTELLCPCAASLLAIVTGGLNKSFSDNADGFDLLLYDVVVQDTQDTSREVVIRRVDTSREQQQQAREAATLAFSQCLSALLVLMNEEERCQECTDRTKSKHMRIQQLTAIRYLYRIVIARLIQTQTTLSRMMNGLQQMMDIRVVQVTPNAPCHSACMLLNALYTFDGGFGTTVGSVWKWLDWRLYIKP